MRSLHVRNIPDEVYEALRKASSAEGRSLSAQTVAILKRALAGHLVDRAKLEKDIAARRTAAGRSRLAGAQLVREDRDR
ncbi:MAG: FitA-like ribbon-helix-helix domain-containing protein [Actinomycetota bacterium]